MQTNINTLVGYINPLPDVAYGTSFCAGRMRRPSLSLLAKRLEKQDRHWFSQVPVQCFVLVREPRCWCCLVLTPPPYAELGTFVAFDADHRRIWPPGPSGPPRRPWNWCGCAPATMNCVLSWRSTAESRHGSSSRNLQVTWRGVREGGTWPDTAAEFVFRDDQALRMCQREGVNWLVFNWCACFGRASSFTPCRLHTTRTSTLWQTAYCICTRAVSPPPS